MEQKAAGNNGTEGLGRERLPLVGIMSHIEIGSDITKEWDTKFAQGYRASEVPTTEERAAKIIEGKDKETVGKFYQNDRKPSSINIPSRTNEDRSIQQVGTIRSLTTIGQQ